MCNLPFTVRSRLIHPGVDKPYLVRFKVFSSVNHLATTIITTETTLVTVSLINRKLPPSGNTVLGNIEEHIVISVLNHSTSNHTECGCNLKSIIEKVFKYTLDSL